jgi:hypothetical protein
MWINCSASATPPRCGVGNIGSNQTGSIVEPVLLINPSFVEDPELAEC